MFRKAPRLTCFFFCLFLPYRYMTLEKLVELGIARKLANEIFMYHVTGFAVDITYYGASRKFIFSSSMTGKVFKEEEVPSYLDFEDFIVSVRIAAEVLHKTGHVLPRVGTCMLN